MVFSDAGSYELLVIHIVCIMRIKHTHRHTHTHTHIYIYMIRKIPTPNSVTHRVTLETNTVTSQ